MRKLSIVFICFVLFAFVPLPTTRAENITYARINNYGVYLYRTPTGSVDFDNLYFAIERTYFVQITANAGEDFYQAKYNGITGYVKKKRGQVCHLCPTDAICDRKNLSYIW